MENKLLYIFILIPIAHSSIYNLQGLDDCCAVNDMGWLQTTGPIDRETKSRYKGSLDCEINQPPFFQTHNVDITIGEDVNKFHIYLKIRWK